MVKGVACRCKEPSEHSIKKYFRKPRNKDRQEWNVVEVPRASDPRNFLSPRQVKQLEGAGQEAMRQEIREQDASHQCIVADTGGEPVLPKYGWASLPAIRQDMMKLKRGEKGTLIGKQIKEAKARMQDTEDETNETRSELSRDRQIQ